MSAETPPKTDFSLVDTIRNYIESSDHVQAVALFRTHPQDAIKTIDYIDLAPVDGPIMSPSELQNLLVQAVPLKPYVICAEYQNNSNYMKIGWLAFRETREYGETEIRVSVFPSYDWARIVKRMGELGVINCKYRDRADTGIFSKLITGVVTAEQIIEIETVKLRTKR